ncbi:hypothetical protein EIN_047380 [Entamoeba invadens IP1]|uniref:Rho-GAP domain-containing protein n=1 Tax=Entamoeba invadens IP1 TaxID=370355 RepID=A0A0A1UH23_ENTIV|nr:hypothetical protein EIN_047380 [Entamoeba invadens IP1]ELP94445.1 hypothetical protein EIN_047380 [Entamoeba invadens IP1]|eukprot:XP_004261216.1 hypothetical protein EIN_047380 [Entamoeba invadens IP1]
MTNAARRTALFASKTRTRPKLTKIDASELNTLETLKEMYNILTEKILMLNIYFSEIEPKKITKMYETVANYITQEELVSFVEYRLGNAKPKKKKIVLKSNFFIVRSVSNNSKHVFYLNHPTLFMEGDATLTVNSLFHIKFKGKEERDKWEGQLSSMTIWVESIPRTVISQTNGIANLKKMDIKSKVAHPLLVKKVKGLIEPQKESLKPKSKIGKKEDNGIEKETFVPFFGMQLEKYGEVYHTDLYPRPIKEVLDYLKKHATKTDGILRLCGSQEKMKWMKERLQFGDTSFLEGSDVYTLASCLKQYIRDFPSAVVNRSVDDEFTKLYKGLFLFVKDELKEEEVVERYLKIFQELPQIVKGFIRDLVEFMYMVLCNSTINRMNNTNIFVCLGPGLRGSPFCYNFAMNHFFIVFGDKESLETQQKEFKEEQIETQLIEKVAETKTNSTKEELNESKKEETPKRSPIVIHLSVDRTGKIENNKVTKNEIKKVVDIKNETKGGTLDGGQHTKTFETKENATKETDDKEKTNKEEQNINSLLSLLGADIPKEENFIQNEDKEKSVQPKPTQ